MNPMYHSPLYVPGDRPAMLEKAGDRGTDLIVIDLEDAVPIASKAAARSLTVEAVPRLRGNGAKVGVRINSFMAEREADLIALNDVELDALMIPKATMAEINTVAAANQVAETDFIALIENGQGLLDAPKIAAHPRVKRLAVGEADLAADLDMEAGDNDPAWIPSRALLVWASSAAGIDGPIGPVFVDLRDLDELRRSTERLKGMGFGGRSAIHPAQVAIINEIFTPTSEELTEARRYVSAYDSAVAKGHGVIVDESGRIVDEALVRRSRRLIAEYPTA